MRVDPRRRALCRRVDIAAEIVRYMEVRRSGEHFRCACPRHDDDPTFPLYIHPGKRVFTCFGCGFSGDVVDFLAEVCEVTAAEAMQALCDSLGLDPERLTEEPPENGGDTPSESAETRLDGLALEEAARRFKLSPEELRAALLGTDSSATDSATTAPAEPAGRAERRPRGQEERGRERAAITSADNLLLAWRGVRNSPRRAAASNPPWSRARIMCSSASLIVPFNPSSNRSLKCAGAYVPSSSRISVSLSAQISRSRCQSALLRANLDTSSPITMPARPRPTSETRCWNPARSAADEPDCP